MSIEALQKFKETLNSAKIVAVRSGDTKDISKILSSHILHSVFLELGKKSSVECGPIDDSIKNSLSILFGESQKNFEIPEHTLIKIDTEKIPISELKYEKEGTILKIILESSENFDPQKILVEKEKIPVDLLLLLDPEEKQIKEILQNTPHKEVVKITSKDKDIAIKIFEIVSMLGKEIVHKFKEAFWTLLDHESEFSKTAISAKKEILEMSPDISKIVTLKEALKTKWFWKLLGRALQRSEVEKELGTLWTFITKDDLEKTNQNESAIVPILNEIKKLRAPENFLAMLWQNGKNEVKAIISAGENFAPQAEKLQNLAVQMGSVLSSSYFFTASFTSFSEAEIKIRSEIKKVLQ